MTHRISNSLILLIMLSQSVVQNLPGAITSWWRFESDSDPSASGLISPNEVGGEPAIISSNATLGFNTPDLFDTFIPGEGLPNRASVRSNSNGGSNSGIFGTAAYSALLDSSSITVEFWVRTTESTAGFVSRTTNNSNAAESATITDGFSIVDPDSVRVSFFTSLVGGESPFLTTLDSDISINDGDWHFIAFRYNEESATADLKVDDQVISTILDQSETRVLWWGAGVPTPEIMVGYQFDGNANNNTGTIDEIRFTDISLQGNELIPEPSQVVFAGIIFLIVLGRRIRVHRREG